MPTIKVYVKTYQDRNKESQVIIMILHKHKKIPIPIPNLKVNIEYWNKYQYLTQSYENRIGLKRKKKQVNELIKTYISKINASIDLVISQNLEINKENIILNIDKTKFDYVNADEKKEKDNLEKSLSKEYLTFARDIKQNQKYQSTAKHLKDFEKTQRGKIKLKNVDKRLFDKFCNYFLDREYNHTTTKKHLDHIRYYLNYISDDISINPNWRKFKFPYKTPENVMNPQSLYKEEIDILFYYRFNDERLNNIRDIFILLYSVGGQRISDLKNILQGDLKKESIKFFQQKTNTKINNPLSSAYTKEILQRNNFNLKLYPDYIINNGLKDLIEEILKDEQLRKRNVFEELFNRYLEYDIYKGRTAKPIIESYHLKEKFSTKFARTSFISIAISEFNMNRDEIASFTGHHDTSIIDHYLHLHSKAKYKLISQFKPAKLKTVLEFLNEHGKQDGEVLEY